MVSILLRTLVVSLIGNLVLQCPAIAFDPIAALNKRVPGEVSGSIALESRYFFSDEQFPGQRRYSGIASVVLQPEWYLEWNGGRDSLTFEPFFRGDSDDPRRTHFDLRQANYLHVEDEWELRFGIGRVFWGVAESQHLVDIVNQTDGVEDIDREDKLGQPMLHLTIPRDDIGIVELFVLPGFRERNFPGRRGRLRAALVVDEDDPDFDSALGRAHVDFALRWSHTLGDWDVAMSHFYGTSRDPRFRLGIAGLPPAGTPDLSSFHLQPVYDLIHQTGLELQYTGENLLLKLEAIGRDGQGSYRAAAVTGFEYTFYGLFDTETDIGVLSEFHFDSFQKATFPTIATAMPGAPPMLPSFEFSAPPTPFAHDVFVGFRLAMNDVQSSELLAGVVVDVKDASRFWNIEASRRLGESFKLSLDARLFEEFPSDSIFRFFNRDDFVQISLAWFF